MALWGLGGWETFFEGDGGLNFGAKRGCFFQPCGLWGFFLRATWGGNELGFLTRWKDGS